MSELPFPPSLIPPQKGGFGLFCFGLGFSAQRLAGALADHGWQISGTAQDKTGLHDKTGDRFVFNRDDFPGAAREALAGASHVLVSVPPDEIGDVVLAAAADDLARLTEGGRLRWLGYLSTTGVYGDTDGRMVDEAAPINPSNARSQRRAAAEEGWLALGRKNGVPVHIFRLSGIYGPGRSALDRVRAGAAQMIHKPGHASSRIHVDDLAGVLMASMCRPHPGAIYNVADDEPCEQADVVAEACRLLAVSPPDAVPFAEAEKTMSPLRRSFWTDNRRIDNAKIKNELGVKLLYPTYREGLRGILAEES